MVHSQTAIFFIFTLLLRPSLSCNSGTGQPKEAKKIKGNENEDRDNVLGSASDQPKPIDDFPNGECMVLLLGLGRNGSNHYLNKFDLVEIDPNNNVSYGEYCNPLADFPRSGSTSSGEFAHGKIITCGGWLSGYSKQCYYYSDNKWVHFGNLTEEKANHDSAILPNGDLWVTGGYNGRDSFSTDIIDKDFNIKRGPDLPVAMKNHCVVNWNETHMILTGGFYGVSDRDETYFFNVETKKWTPGPSMNYKRSYHGCVSFEDTDGKKKVMVIGGYPLSSSKTAELFDGASWTILDVLPISIYYAKAVVYEGKVIVTGSYLPSAWVFDIATRKWSEGFKMNPPIKYHNSFLVPKSYCHKN